MKIQSRLIDPREIILLELNARYMTHEQYKQLVDNIRADQALTSTPFCWLHEGKYYCLSGNHRVKGSIDADLPEILILYTEDLLPEEKRIALQLSHNALTGQDDPAILKELYEKIKQVELKVYSGLDDKTLKLLAEVKPISISESNLKFQTLTMTFLPNELEEAKQIIDQALTLQVGDDRWLLRMAEYDKWLNSIEIAGASYNIKNVATAFRIILDVFTAHQDDLSEAWADREDHSWVPLSTITGTDKIPISAAKIIKTAVDSMMAQGQVTKKNAWQALEYWAADYLAGE